MRYIWLVAAREFAENAKTKGFWLGIILLPIMALIAIQVQKVLKKATPVRHFVLVDQSGAYGETIERAVQRDLGKQRRTAYDTYVQEHTGVSAANVDLDKISTAAAMAAAGQGVSDEALLRYGTDAGWEKLKAHAAKVVGPDVAPLEDPGPRYVAISVPEDVSADAPPDEIARALRPYLLQRQRVATDDGQVDLFAAVIIPRDVRRQNPQYWSINLADTGLTELVQRTINDEYRRRAYVARGVDVDAVAKVQAASLPVNKKNPKKEEGREDVSMADVIRQWAPIGFVYLLWVAIFTVSQMLLNNTIEEKSNRIIEVLLSSVTARELMWGKLLGIALIGLTMVSAWILTTLAILFYHKSPETQMINQVLNVLQTSNLIPYFVVYFLFGFLFYAGIFLSIGSICNTLKEAQNFMGPIMMVMMVPLVTMFFIPKDPNGTLATVLSWIPLYTPFVMMNRTAADPPMFDQVGTIVLMIVSTAAMLWLSAKIFRTGILRSGQPPRLVEIFRWLKSS